MAGIKDGISGGLSSDKKGSEGLGLNADQFISINDSAGTGLNYKDVQTEGFYVVPVWKWMIEDISALEALIPVLYKLKEENPELYPGRAETRWGMESVPRSPKRSQHVL